LRTISALNASFPGTILAPASTKSESRNLAPVPAPCSITTLNPFPVRTLHACGERATRFSSRKDSLGTPMVSWS